MAHYGPLPRTKPPLPLPPPLYLARSLRGVLYWGTWLYCAGLYWGCTVLYCCGYALLYCCDAVLYCGGAWLNCSAACPIISLACTLYVSNVLSLIRSIVLQFVIVPYWLAKSAVCILWYCLVFLHHRTMLWIMPVCLANFTHWGPSCWQRIWHPCCHILRKCWTFILMFPSVLHVVHQTASRLSLPLFWLSWKVRFFRSSFNSSIAGSVLWYWFSSICKAAWRASAWDWNFCSLSGYFRCGNREFTNRCLCCIYVMAYLNFPFKCLNRWSIS